MKLNALFGALLLLAAVAGAFAAERRSPSADRGPSDDSVVYAGPRDTIVFAVEDDYGDSIYLAPSSVFFAGTSTATGELRTVQDARLIAVQFDRRSASSEAVHSFKWSPDGRRIFYLVMRGVVTELTTFDLWSMSSDGSDRKLEQADFLAAQPQDFWWYPLSELIDWTGHGYDYVRVTPSEPMLSIHGSASPDGGRVVYRWTGLDDSALCVAERQPLPRFPLAGSQVGICGGTGLYSMPAWSPE